MITLKDLLRSKTESSEDSPAMDLEPIKKLFGDDEPLPEIDETQVGKIRLLKALRQKFGASYRSLPHVKQALEHYNKESKFLELYKRTSEARRGR